jgi:hypothetical protein
MDSEQRHRGQNKTITSGGETIEGDKPLDRDKKRK